jgi:hypothetical protein
MNPNERPIREADEIRQDCARKLRGVEVSDYIQAIDACQLGEECGFDHDQDLMGAL